MTKTKNDRPRTAGLTKSLRGASPQPATAFLRTSLPNGWRRGLKFALHELIPAISLASFALPTAAQQIVLQPSSAYPHAIAAGYKALTLCEGIFTAGRTEEQIAAVELRGIYAEYDAIVPKLRATIDRNRRSVSVPFASDLAPRRADWARSGCTLAPIGQPIVAGKMVQRAEAIGPAPADPRPWPMGDREISPRPSAALATTISRAFDHATYGQGETLGIVIVRDGRIVGERYADGFGPFVPNRTWSVAKSIAGTMIGIVTRDLGIDPMKTANIPEWRAARDPRQSITLDNLMRMVSGLHSDHYGNRTDAIYFGGTTVTEQAAGWPLEAKPGTRFRYANNDILLAARAIRATMNDDARYAAWPTQLFAPLGMQHTTAGTDWRGNFLLSSQVWTTARDLARLGQFWLQDGVWQGKRLLPAGWMRYMTTPAGPQPSGDGPGYGATMWLFGPKQNLPAGSYSAQGNRGQFVMVVPSERLVIVRRGEDPGTARFDIANFTADVIRDRP